MCVKYSGSPCALRRGKRGKGVPERKSARSETAIKSTVTFNNASKFLWVCVNVLPQTFGPYRIIQTNNKSKTSGVTVTWTEINCLERQRKYFPYKLVTRRNKTMEERDRDRKAGKDPTRDRVWKCQDMNRGQTHIAHIIRTATHITQTHT